MNMNESKKLPVFHIYIPLTLPKVVKTYFTEHDECECLYLLGQYKEKIEGEGTPSSESKEEVTLRKSKSKKPDSKSAQVVYSQQSSVEVIEITLLGIAPEQTIPSAFVNKKDGVQIVGMIFAPSIVSHDQTITTKRKIDFSSFRYPLLLQCQFTQELVQIPYVIWNGTCYDFSTALKTHLFMFEYDPLEIQRWKYPDSYPIGLPLVFIKGFRTIHGLRNNASSLSEQEFIPAFDAISQDHQDLNACFTMSDSSIFNSNDILRFLCQRSSGLKQIAHKVSISTDALLRTYPLLPVVNFIFLLVLDSVIGYMISRYLLQFPSLLGLLHENVESMLDKLNHLLKWLRGAPAGLKLNPNLNSLYWRFFSYHIHLWASYIGILEPMFAIIINTIQYFGVLGATVQMALMKDLLSLATFHVYCLYIYASRLYGLQISALQGLFRVFFGRKYNPLRQRVDSVQLTTPELFLSSFVFVILIFLLPTTLVYYAGFVCLRVPALITERILEYMVKTYNGMPFLSWLLVFCRSPRVADEIYLEPKGYNQSSSMVTFRIRLQSTRTLFAPPNFAGEIKYLVASILGGTVLKE